MSKKFKPLLGKDRDKRISDAMKYTKKDLAIMYVDLKWCFDLITKDCKQINKKF